MPDPKDVNKSVKHYPKQHGYKGENETTPTLIILTLLLTLKMK